jgi:soluble lytic murein transglycosylase-like protein
MRLTKFLATLLLSTFIGAAAPPAAAPAPSDPDAAWISTRQAIQQQSMSLDKQRRSIYRQLGEPVDAAGIPVADFIDPLPALLLAPCPALDQNDVNAMITEAARKQALAPELLRAVMKQESAFKPCAVSVRGAQGLMQLMPATSQQFHVSDPFDPAQNVRAGAAFLKQLLTRYKGDLRLALVAYNAGPVWADQQGSRPFPAETQNYLASIFADLKINQSSPDTPEVSGATDPANVTNKTETLSAKTGKP